MKRREWLRNVGLAGAAFSMVPGSRIWAAPAPAYDGPLFVMVEADGAWDVSSFCDPKANVPGDREINHWSRNAEVQQAGNIPYAPFADNAAFFEKYHDYLLVVNGVDAQTNAHTVGRIHNWSGRLSVGYPSLPAQLASVYGSDLPMAWINNGSYSTSANLTRHTRLDNPYSIRELILSNDNPWGGEHYLEPAAWDDVRALQQARLAALRDESNLLPWQRRHRSLYHEAREKAGELRRFAEVVPTSEDELEPAEIDGQWATIRRQAQLALLAMQSGVAMAADIVHWNFDTHDNHDEDHAQSLRILTQGIDYLWDTAEAMGLADRLTVLVSSDFSRTPYYNDDNGKDHWAIGSAMFMQKNAAWGNRVVGLTDEGQNAIPINPTTLQPDSTNGITIYPRHIISGFRRLAGIDTHPLIEPYVFFNNEDIDLFNPARQTPQG